MVVIAIFIDEVAILGLVLHGNETSRFFDIFPIEILILLLLFESKNKHIIKTHTHSSFISSLSLLAQENFLGLSPIEGKQASSAFVKLCS